MTTMRRIVLGLVAMIGLLGITGSAEALLIRDQCNQTSGDGQGHRCPAGDYLLIRWKDALGFCGDWVCCPANGDGTYDCTKGTTPTSSTISGALKGLLGNRVTTTSPVVSPGTKKSQILQQQTAPILRRGVEGDEPGPQESAQGSSSESGEVQERALPRQRLGVAEANCNCDGGSGTCTVTIGPDQTSKCTKGAGTCTGTCTYPPPGTVVTGFGSRMMRQ